MSENHRLSLHEITKNYEGKPLLNGISFEVNSGEVLCLLGRSGSGKSTLLRIIAGIENADSGSVLWDDEDLSGTPTHLRHFGLMFQDYALFPHRNVAENVAFGLRMQKIDSAEIDRRVLAALEQVNMVKFGDRRVTDLSGGEQQRVALARALASAPRLLMLDEPLAALDRALREQLQQELREVLQRTGIPAIYVTHDQEEALALGDRMALLNEGQIVQIGSPDVFYRWPKNLWVAQFLAMENVFSGQVVKTVPLQVQTAIGLLHASTASGSNLTSGDQVTLVITPAADFTLLNGEQINLVKGVCRDCLFMGEYYQITLSLQGGQNFVFRSNHAVNKGVEIPFCLPVENVICLK